MIGSRVSGQNRYFLKVKLGQSGPKQGSRLQDRPRAVESAIPRFLTLIQLSVSDPRYILRKPLLFTNLASLFPGTAPIFTNRPVKPVCGVRTKFRFC